MTRRLGYPRAILSGAMVWLLIIATFYVLGNLDATRHSLSLQGGIAIALTPFFATVGAWFYYRRMIGVNGMHVGAVMTFTALSLDVLITVPLVEMPNGGSYQTFFSSAILWSLAVANLLTVFTYWSVCIRGRDR